MIHLDNLKPLKVNKTTYWKLQRIIQNVTNSELDVIVQHLCPSDEVPEENIEDQFNNPKNSEAKNSLPVKDKTQDIPFKRSREENNGHLSTQT